MRKEYNTIEYVKTKADALKDLGSIAFALKMQAVSLAEEQKKHPTISEKYWPPLCGFAGLAKEMEHDISILEEDLK